MKSSVATADESASYDSLLSLVVDSGMSGLRLDQFLAHHIPAVSRSLIISSIRGGLIVVDGAQRKSSYRLKVGQVVQGSLKLPPEIEVKPEKIDFPIIYEDEFLLVISKPPGIVVHPGSGNHQATLVSGLVHHCLSIGLVGDRLRPGIVHRLDKDTSGVMVVAKSNAVHRSLVDDFKNRRLDKEYLALLHGSPGRKKGRIVAPIGRHPVQRQKMAVRTVGGRYAATTWDVVEKFDNGNSLVRVNIETGRTHQIRVHMAHLGCPVAGDTIYGSGRDNSLFDRQMLHAFRLSFNHPVSGRRLDCCAPLWDDFRNILKAYGFDVGKG
jgi:23S rRNA pseudouridine1911/1915/1917 synthase